MYLSIKEFSNRTGLPPSKLRFYDKKGLITPSVRLDNGYRAYSVEQIPQAKLVDSFRQAEISIEDIKHYCAADEKEKKILLDSWKADLNRKMEALMAARKYIGGMDGENPQTLLLSKWEAEKYFVWQRFEVERVPHPFRECMLTAKERLEKHGETCSQQVYIKNDSITKNHIIGEIGFEVCKDFKVEKERNFRLEIVPPTLFAVLQGCRAYDDFLCFSYIQVVIRYGFQPSGTKLERYSSTNSQAFDYLIPLI